MGSSCCSGKSGKENSKPRADIPSVVTNKTRIEVPEEVDTNAYKKTFIKFTSLLDVIGDTSRLPSQTLAFVNKLFEAKTKVDQSLETLEKDQTNEREIVYKLFIKFHQAINEIIARLLHDKAFNEAYPIIREAFKEVYHQFEKQSKTLSQILDKKSAQTISSQCPTSNSQAIPMSGATLQITTKAPKKVQSSQPTASKQLNHSRPDRSEDYLVIQNRATQSSSKCVSSIN